MNKKVKHGTLLTVIFTVLSLLYLYPIVLVFINSFKKKAYISKAPFEIPTGKMYVGYLSCEDKVHKSLIYALSVCNDRTIPDGNVYII